MDLSCRISQYAGVGNIHFMSVSKSLRNSFISVYIALIFHYKNWLTTDAIEEGIEIDEIKTPVF